MSISRRLLSALAILAALPFLAGCPAPGGVLSTLPPPLVHTPRITPSTPLPTRIQPTVSSSVSLRGATIVIDPGHGGKDPGAGNGGGIVSRHVEKDIVLDIGLRISRLLTERGANVIMTRSTDVFIPLERRAAIAERSHADLFVSIHVDSLPSKPNISGAKVYIYTQASSQSQKAAMSMVNAFKKANIYCRGLDRQNFHVLREHSRPAMLIECGFLTNRTEARNLDSASYRARLAAAIADGIGDYFGP